MNSKTICDAPSLTSQSGIAQPLDLGAFHRHDRTGEFNVSVRITGTMYLTVTADDAATARRQVADMIENGDVELFSDDIEDANIDSVYACPAMYLVRREGREMGVSHVQPGDVPCEPTSEYTASQYRPPATKAEGSQ